LCPDHVLEIYCIEVKTGKIVLFAASDVLEQCEEESDDRVRRFIVWMSNHRYRVIAWLGRVLNSARGYYVSLEARLDPVERVLKAMSSTRGFIVMHSNSTESNLCRKQFFTKLRHQRLKHLFWFVLDLLLSAASLVLAWLPGPNIVGWYPFLRSLSHYRAFSGCVYGLRASGVQFKGLPELHRLEENLQAPDFDRKRIHVVVKELKITGLEQFLERMV
jgi:hypothetical protein